MRRYWPAVALAAILALPALATVSGTISRWVGNTLVFDGSSGSNGFQMDTDGLRGKLGSGSEAFVSGNSTHLIAGTGTGAGYWASQNTRIVPVYINNLVAAFTYGGGQLDARATTVNAIRFHVRTAGATGSTPNVFRIQDESGNICDCAFACNQTTDGGIGASKRFACSTDGGGCAFPASAVRVYRFSSVGDCVIPVDITGNLEIEEVPQ